MEDSPAVIDQVHRDSRLRLAFLSAVVSLAAASSGALVQYGPSPRHLTYLVAVGSLSLSAVLIVVSPETVTRTPGAWRSLRPSVRVPSRVRGLLPVAAAVFLSTWATGAFYQAFVPGLVEDQLHSRSSLVLGLVFAAFMAPSVLGAPLGGRFTPAAGQRVGMTVFLAGWIGITRAITTDSLTVFIAPSSPSPPHATPLAKGRADNERRTQAGRREGGRQHRSGPLRVVPRRRAGRLALLHAPET